MGLLHLLDIIFLHVSALSEEEEAHVCADDQEGEGHSGEQDDEQQRLLDCRGHGCFALNC